jgi:heptose I phosphotransferase
MTANESSELPADPAGLGFVAIDESMWIEPRFQAALEQAGLSGFDAVMASRRGHCWRAFPDRENWRLELPAPGGGRVAVHLKKHRARCAGDWLRAKLGLAARETAAEIEARNAARLTRDGIDVMRLVAYGWKRRRDGLVESFMISEELEGYWEVPDLLRRRFRPAAVHSPRRDRDLDELIRTVADVARRFHAAGYNHRDFYCGHLFVREPAPGRFEIRLIDLQRVQCRRRWRRRWIVKDLAQLAWSLPGEQISCSRRMAFMRRYLGVDKLRPRHKRLIRELLAKQQIMERKLGPAVYGERNR